MNNRGVSLISLIITIIVIIILASIAVYGSLDTIQDANNVKRLNEYNNVCTYIEDVSSRVAADLLSISITDSTLATEEQIMSFYIFDSDESEFTSGDAQKIKSINDSVRDSGRNPKFGYHYITGKQIENGITGINYPSKLDDVKENYLVNFYYGVIIGKVSDTKTNVTGTIK